MFITLVGGDQQRMDLGNGSFFSVKNSLTVNDKHVVTAILYKWYFYGHLILAIFALP